MKKIFKRLCVTVLSFLMVVSSTTLPAFAEDTNYNERNDIANSFRYSNGRAKKRGYANYATRASLNSGWPDDPKAICKGIDVSYHNGTIDWKRVKQSEVKYAIIRCGYGKNVKSQDDKKWEENVRGCTDNNIPYGVYLYSYADNVEKASSEADHAIRLLEGKKFKYPVYYDLEEDKIRDRLTKQQIADIAQTFCDKLSARGYTVGIYANKNWFTNYLTDSRFNNWTKWVAQYNTVCNYHGKYDMWQCSSSGSIPGISGRVDLNYSYSPFEYTGLAQYGSEWHYIENGKVNWNYTGLAQHGNEWFYIEKGKLNWDYSGIVEYNNQWFYVERGRLNWNYTGLGQSGNDWYYIVGGRVNWNYTGLVQKGNEWFYVKGGKLDWNHSGLIYYNNTWFYIDHGRINWNYSNPIYYNNAWFYIDHGYINWNFTDLVLYNGTWYYVKNGQIDWNYTGLVYHAGGWYYVSKGKLDWNHSGLIYYNNNWFYIDHGYINWDYSNLIYYNNAWFYVYHGMIHWDYSDLVLYNGTWYYVKNGQIDWNYT
ncbi:GH25 family lysozyme, partial [Catenibacterium faecis]|uniref:glycoside hydrolase family 25 protein n=1 Tax=Catenibacterium faecis TaxID=2764323 RepID=UPI003F7D9333